MTFQQIILTLQKFWSVRGCILEQPYDVEKGAGTMNPATFLRTIGPEPWNVAYVEPSRRPTWRMWNRPAALMTDVTAIIRTVCTSTISSRSS